MGKLFGNKNKVLERLQKNRLLLWILIVLITALWGYAWVLMKTSLQYMGPFTFSAFRFGVGTITLLLLVWVTRMGFPERKYWRHLFVVGILQTSIVFLFVMYGLEFVEAGKSSVLLYSMPLWSSLLAAKYLNEKLTTLKLTGLLLGVAGLLTILGWDIWGGQSWKTIIGESFIIIAALSWGLSNVYFRIHLQHLPKVQTSAFQMLFGTIAIIIAAFVMEWDEPIKLTGEIIYNILFTGIIASALCFTVWFMILSLLDMVSATLSTLLVPIFGLFFSSILLDEKITVGIISGTGLIIAGIAISYIKKRGKSRVQMESVSRK